MQDNTTASVDISYVLTVYNKAEYLPATLASLKQQEGDMQAEYVFVDDCSTDQSVQLIEHYTKDWSRVVIVRNRENRGPSVRVNQGVRVASGRYVCLMDSDDILAANAANVMWSLLEKFQAGVAYGKWQKTGKTAKDLLGIRMKDYPDYFVSYNPLEYILYGRFVRMTLMARRDLFLAAGGCDERIFVQDESLPLRLGYHAKAFIDIREPVILVPQGLHTLSSNKAQQHHDRFFAYKHALEDFRDINPKVRQMLYQRAISSAWKHVRATTRYPYLSKIFWYYLQVTWLSLSPDEEKLLSFEKMFRQLGNVRRMEG